MNKIQQAEHIYQKNVLYTHEKEIELKRTEIVKRELFLDKENDQVYVSAGKMFLLKDRKEIIEELSLVIENIKQTLAVLEERNKSNREALLKIKSNSSI